MQTMRLYWKKIAAGWIAAALLLAACGGNPAPAAPALPDTGAQPAVQEAPAGGALVKVKVVMQPYVTLAPFYFAQQEGFFSKQGLEVEFVNLSQTQQVVPTIASGQADVGASLVTAGVFNAIARGGKFKVTANKGYIDPAGCADYALVAQKDQAGLVKTAADLKGRTVDVVPASWLEYYLATILKTGGLTLNDIQMTDTPSTAEMEALNQGTVAFTLNSDPWVTRYAQAGHPAILASPAEVLPDSDSALIYYGPKLLGENAEAGKRFMVAYLQGVRQYNEGPTERNLQLMAEFTKLDPALLKQLCWTKVRATGEVNHESLLAFQEWAKSAGLQETVVPVDQYWDGRFVEYAAGTLNGQ